MIATQGFENDQRIATSGFGGLLAVTTPVVITPTGGVWRRKRIHEPYPITPEDAMLLATMVTMYQKHREAKA